MPLAGTGSTSQYFSAASPITSEASKPFSLVAWGYLGGTNAALAQIANGTSRATASLLFQSGGVYITEYDDAGTEMYGGPGNPGQAAWYMESGVFKSATSMTGYFNSTAHNGSGSLSTETFTELHLGVAITEGAALGTNGLVAYVSLWSGALSAADISSLYGGGTSGTDPRNLVSTGGATLLRLYVPNGASDLADHSGNGGPTLAAVGGAVASYNNTTVAPVSAYVPPATGQKSAVLGWWN